MTLSRVDLSDFDSRKAQIGAELLAAAETLGFFQVVNHCIPEDELAATARLARSFFALPDNAKRATSGDASNPQCV